MGEVEEGKGWINGGGKVNTQYNIQMIYNCTLEAYIILLTNVTRINSIKIFKRYLRKKKPSFLEEPR